ncbi:MAG: helix-turn-helix transcriptional regulator [Alphaproteobacteria bacterium]|nr:helix-turn-helix transcriptional regulator [Alphaproteobacteria bacterium]
MKNNELLQFGANIKRLRLALDMSQDDLAALCGYTSRSSIAKIETGSADIPQAKIKLFADALHVKPSEILAAVPVEPLPEPIAEIETISKDFSESQLQRLLEYAKMLKYLPED